MKSIRQYVVVLSLTFELVTKLYDARQCAPVPPTSVEDAENFGSSSEKFPRKQLHHVRHTCDHLFPLFEQTSHRLMYSAASGKKTCAAVSALSNVRTDKSQTHHFQQQERKITQPQCRVHVCLIPWGGWPGKVPASGTRWYM